MAIIVLNSFLLARNSANECLAHLVATGHAPGSTDVQEWTVSSSHSTEAVNTTLKHGDTFYASVLCKNKIGLERLTVSKAVVVVTNPPDMTSAKIQIGKLVYNIFIPYSVQVLCYLFAKCATDNKYYTSA